MKRLLSWFERKKYSNEAGQVELPPVISSSFSPCNPLEELLIKAGYEPEARPLFEQCFMDHAVLIAIRDDGQAEGVLDESGDLGVYSLTADDGQSYPVAFTAEERAYDCFGPETVLAKLPGRNLLEMVSGAGVWVNPSSPFGVLWSAQDLARISGQ